MMGNVEEEELNEESEGDKELDPGFGAEVMDAFKIGAIFYGWIIIYLLVCSLTVIREWRA